MTQKVLKVGTSLGVTIPKGAAVRLGIRAGDLVTVDVHPESGLLTVRADVKRSAGSARRNRIAKLTADFIDRYRADLEALARK